MTTDTITRPAEPQAGAPAKSYKPRTDSVASQVIAFFARNPEESLSTDDIADKFDVTRGNIHTHLRLALEAKIIKRTRSEDGGYIYGAANVQDVFGGVDIDNIHTVWGPGTRKTASMARQKRQASPGATAITSPRIMVDIAALPVTSAVPYMGELPGRSKWAPLFERLTKAGQSVEIPANTKGAIAAAARVHNKTHPGAYRVALTSPTTARVWRTE